MAATAIGATARATLLVATVVVGACARRGDAVPSPVDPAPPPTPAPVVTAAATPSSTGIVSVTLETTVTADGVVLRLAGPVKRGQRATVSAGTAPNAECSITVTSAAASRVEGLGAKGADGAGNVSWSWTVEAGATPGAWPVEVSCIAASASGIRAVARDVLRVE